MRWEQLSGYLIDCHVILKLSETVMIQNQYYLQSLVLCCIKNHYLKSIPFISVSKHWQLTHLKTVAETNRN